MPRRNRNQPALDVAVRTLLEMPSHRIDVPIVEVVVRTRDRTKDLMNKRWEVVAKCQTQSISVINLVRFFVQFLSPFHRRHRRAVSLMLV